MGVMHCQIEVVEIVINCGVRSGHQVGGQIVRPAVALDMGVAVGSLK